MNVENDEFSLSEKDTLIQQQVADKPLPEFRLVRRTPKKTLLERLPLSNTTPALMGGSREVHLPIEAFQQRMFRQWNLKNIYQHIMTDALYRNSLFGMASTFVLGGLGFVFWIIIAHLYKTEDVGIATTLISLIGFLSGFTILGLNSSLTRHLSNSAHKNELINSSFVIVAIATLLPSVIFFVGLPIFSPRLLFLRSNIFYILSFIIFTMFTSWNILVDGIFMAFRAAGNILMKSIIIGLVKLVLPLALIGFGAYGIFASNALAFALGVLIGLFALYQKFKIRFSISINLSLLKEYSAYSLANYIVVFIRGVPPSILPIIVLNTLSAKFTAYCYIALMIENTLLIIPVATEVALLAEGSHNEAELKKHVKKAIATILVILLPATAIIILFGNILLQFFGKGFAAEAFQFLQLISASVSCAAFVFIASAILNIKRKIKLLVIFNIAVVVLKLCMVYAFISGGLLGIGWGLTLAQIIAGLVSIYLIIRNCSDTSQSRVSQSKVQEVLE